MDKRNYRFDKKINPDMGLQVSEKSKPIIKPAFFAIKENRFWSELQEGVCLKHATGAVGVDADKILSYNKKSGNYYGNRGNNLLKIHENDLGTDNLEEVKDIGFNCYHLAQTDLDTDEDSEHFVFTKGTSVVYYMEGWDGTETEVLDMANYGGASIPTGINGLDIDGYGRVLISQYGDKEDEPFRVFLSEDYGKTWEVIFYLPDFYEDDYKHVHSVNYDPYDNWIIVTTGDGGITANTFISYDNGENWWSIFDTENNQIQMTGSMSFPNHIVLGADVHRNRGVMIIPKNMIKDKVFGGLYLSPHEVFHQQLYSQPGTAVPYFRTSNQPNNQKIGYGTDVTCWGISPGGYRSPIFISENGLFWNEILNVDGSAQGICGPDSNNLIMISQGHNNPHYVFKVPEFIN